MVTPALFAACPTPQAMAQASLEELESYIKTCGFHHSKAKDIIACAQKLVNEFDGQVPRDLDTLLTLPGVGRKSANLIMGDIWGEPAIVADTHCIRLSNRMGFIDSDDPVKVEFALKKVVAPEESNDFCHRLVLHGRAVCTARKAMCEACCLQQLCRTGKKTLPKPPKAGA
jgi:endonuclease-3